MGLVCPTSFDECRSVNQLGISVTHDPKRPENGLEHGIWMFLG
jgi:hypothetical protein